MRAPPRPLTWERRAARSGAPSAGPLRAARRESARRRRRFDVENNSVAGRRKLRRLAHGLEALRTPRTSRRAQRGCLHADRRCCGEDWVRRTIALNLAVSSVSWCGLLRRRRSFWIETTAAAPVDGDGSGSAGLGVWWTRTDCGGFAPWPDFGSRAATVLELRRLAPRPDFGSRAATAHELRRLAPWPDFGSRAAAVHLARPAAVAALGRDHFHGGGRRLRPPATRAPWGAASSRCLPWGRVAAALSR